MKIAIISALWHYKKFTLDKFDVDENTSVEKVTKAVNGGTHNLADRQTKFNKAKIELSCK